MQDQGKRLLIAVAAALGFMLLWNMIFPSKPEDQQTTTGSGSGSQVIKSPTPGVTPGESPTGVIGTTPSGPDAEKPPTQGTEPSVAASQRGPEKRVPLKFPNIEATFSNYCGTLVGWKLTDSRYENDETKGQLIPPYASTGAFQVN